MTSITKALQQNVMVSRKGPDPVPKELAGRERSTDKYLRNVDKHRYSALAILQGSWGPEEVTFSKIGAMVVWVGWPC